MSVPTKISNRSITRKIIIAFLLAAATIVFSIAISNTSFRKVQARVEQLSKPNPRLQLVNQLFRDIVVLDQLQRDQTLNLTSDGYRRFVSALTHVQLMLDTLKQMSSGNEAAVQRVDSMKDILHRHDRMLLEYLQLNTNISRIDTLKEQVRNLARLIESAADSARVSTENRIVTTIEQVPDSSQFKQERQTLWERIFARRKTPEVQQAKRLIREYYDVKIDTLGMDQNDSNIHRLSTAIANAEQNRLSQRNALLRQQMKLSAASDALIAQTLSILRDLEQKELLEAQQNSHSAKEIISRSIFNINLVLVIFIIGTALLLYIILADVARSNTYRQQLLEAKEEAEQLGSVKQRFLANMSHELRTPLQIIIGATEQMRSPEQVSPERLNILQQTAQHLLQIVNEVLDYSRIVSGKFRFEEAPFDMSATIEEVCAVMAVQAEHKGLAFQYVPDVTTGRMFLGDAFRLRQILYNLLGNAVKYTQQGTVTLEVQQKKFARHSVFRFLVLDTGPGIREEELGIIFNQFEQGEAQGISAKGSGLGLNITYLLVTGQQGTITVHSEWGKGTRFEVSIPYRLAPDALTEPKGDPVLPPIGNTLTWVVDDDPFILRLCGEILDKHGVPNRRFGSAEALLAALPEEKLHFLFLDIRLPGMDGIALCRELRRRLGNRVRIIALTAQAMPDERESIMAAGFDLLLTKPFLEKDLISLIAGYMPETIQYEVPERPAPDLGPIRRMVGDSEEMLQQIVQQLLSETTKDLDQVARSLRTKDPEAAAHYLHRIAGRMGQVGAIGLAGRCRSLELALREGGLAQEDFGQLYPDIRNVLDQIRDDRSSAS